MTEQLAKQLKELANKYEVPAFYDADPSQFLKWYTRRADVEAASFIAAMLAFGNRKQFIPKIRQILQQADKTSGSISAWLVSGAYKTDFPTGVVKFYRFYSYDDMHCLFEELAAILKEAGTLGEYFKGEVSPCLQPAEPSSATPSSGDTPQRPDLAQIIAASFPKSAIVPKGKTSANKRVHMFLRWMVRQNSPVDLDLWSWYSPADLLIPLDVHVMQEGIKLGLLPQNATASKKTAVLLTQKMAEVFPGDPVRADFALFGLGVDEEKIKN